MDRSLILGKISRFHNVLTSTFLNLLALAIVLGQFNGEVFQPAQAGKINENSSAEEKSIKRKSNCSDVDKIVGNDEVTCPSGYRLPYHGLCINLEDERADNPEKGVRMVEPGVRDGGE